MVRFPGGLSWLSNTARENVSGNLYLEENRSGTFNYNSKREDASDARMPENRRFFIEKKKN